jgi:hypothetical protein
MMSDVRLRNAGFESASTVTTNCPERRKRGSIRRGQFAEYPMQLLSAL